MYQLYFNKKSLVKNNMVSCLYPHRAENHLINWYRGHVVGFQGSTWPPWMLGESVRTDGLGLSVADEWRWNMPTDKEWVPRLFRDVGRDRCSLKLLQNWGFSSCSGTPGRGRQVGVAQGESRAVVACTVNGPGASLGLEVSITCG